MISKAKHSREGWHAAGLAMCRAVALSAIFVVGGLFLSAGRAPAGQERPPVQNPKPVIKLGMSTALTGPASFLGTNMRSGVLAAIDQCDREGGIQGLPIELICLDDGYEPTRTAPNMRRLINQDQVLAVIGNVGTPTAVAAIPIANSSKTTFFGAGILRKSPPDRYVINYRASYAEEVSAMIDALLGIAGYKPHEIAFFTQRDAYGDAGYIGGIAALRKHGFVDENKIIHSRYERNTLAVENGLADIILADPLPRAVIMVGTYAPCAEFIRMAKANGFSPLFLNVSFVGAEPLAADLGAAGNGVIVTQVVPHYTSDLPIVSDFRKALAAYDSSLTPSFVSLEGYISARILFKGLKTIQGDLSREAVAKALENLGTFHLGLDAPLHLSPDDHQASHRIWPMVLKNGRAVPFRWEELANRRERRSND